MTIQVDIARPDVALLLDSNGTIRKVTLAQSLNAGDTRSWVGRSWAETVSDVGDEKINRMIDEANIGGVSAFRQFTQNFPSGLELPMEYTTVKLGSDDSLLAVGKNLESVAELQSRLVSAQQAMEREYWKLRYLETRYRLLLDASNDPVLLVKASDLSIIESNPSASRALGLPARGSESLENDALLDLVPEKERTRLEAMLLRVRDHGKAPALQIPFGQDRNNWFVQASLVTSEQGLVFMVQLTASDTKKTELDESAEFMQLVKRAPDAVVMLDDKGKILKTNQAFLEMVQMGAEASVEGQQLSRWLGRPGADLRVLLGSVAQHGSVRLFSTSIQGELGISTEVEISAIGNEGEDHKRIALVLRDVGSRLPVTEHKVNNLGSQLGALSEQVGTSPLRDLVKDTVGILESHYIQAALEMTGGNRTAAAEILGISRQSLYAKLNRYDVSGEGSQKKKLSA